MAPRTTRSASRAARLAEAVATGPLGALSHDELGVIFDGLADPLQPELAVALSSTCLGLRTPLRAALQLLKGRHGRAKALCRKLGGCCAGMRLASVLVREEEDVTAYDMATIGMVLRTNGLPQLVKVRLNECSFGDAGMLALFEGMGHGAAPSLTKVSLNCNDIGPAGAEALAAALRRGAMPNLQGLFIGDNPLGDAGAAALATHLRKLPGLCMLELDNSGIGDEGVASLLDNLGKDDFKNLKQLWLDGSDEGTMTSKGLATLVSVLNSGAMPKLEELILSRDGGEEEEALAEAGRARNVTITFWDRWE